MTEVMTPSKAITREQAGKFCDTLVPRLEKSGLQCEPFQKVLGDKGLSGKLGDEIVALVRKHVDLIGDTVRVDRSVRPAYPDWMEKLLHPELEGTGPAEYDLIDVEQWLHDGQKDGNYMRGERIYEHLESNHMLESCLGLADLLAIQKLGLDVFRKHFAGEAVFAWKSVVRSRGGHLHVPCLIEYSRGVCLFWYWLGVDWGAGRPALRLAR